MDEQKVPALVCGGVMGAVVLFIILANILCCVCRRRKHHKRRDHKKLRPQSPHVSPSHSQPSTLGTMVSNTMPKVSSTGLWMDTPGVYAMAPPKNYYYDRQHGYHPHLHGMDHLYHVPRVMSESRIPQPGLPYVPHRPQYGSQNNVFLLPVGHQRFYHSQPLAPVYELPPPRGMEIYDYPFSGQNGGFRSQLLETRHTPDYYNTGEFTLKARVERAKSDAENRRPTKPPVRKDQQPKQKNTPSQENGRRTSNVTMSWQPYLLGEDRGLLNSSQGSTHALKTTNEHVHGERTNKEFSTNTVTPGGRSIAPKVHDSKLSEDRLPLPKNIADPVSTTVSSSENIPSSATDSMKLLAKNKTDDQKTKPSFAPLVVDNNTNNIDKNDHELNIKHYTYEGSIYSVPGRDIQDIDHDNPIVHRMKEMAIERTRGRSSPINNWNNTYENASFSNNVKTITGSTDTFAADMTQVIKVTKTKVIESYESDYTTEQQASTNIDVLDGLDLPDILVAEDESFKRTSPRVSIQHKSSTRAQTSTAAANRSEQNVSSNPLTVRARDVLSQKLSENTDSGTDDINKAGKQIATSAFQFLDSYLSDDEGAESLIESPPVSPGGLKVGQVY